jgi:hypothetical protein
MIATNVNRITAKIIVAARSHSPRPPSNQTNIAAKVDIRANLACMKAAQG